MSYADAVARFGAGLSRGELQGVYGRAGESFAGHLQLNYVVLHNKVEGKGNSGTGPSGGVASPAVGEGRKRGNDEVGVQAAAKRQVRGGGGRGGSIRSKASAK